MKRVDIIGAAGVGKTTLVRELLKQREGASWMISGEAKLAVARRLAGTTARAPKNTIKSLLSRISGFEWSRYLLFESVLTSEGRESLWSKREAYREFLSACIEALRADNTHPVRRIWDIEFLMDVLQDIALLEHHGIEETVIFEDSLSQRAGALASLGGIEHAHSKQLLMAMPIPSAIIYLRADPETIAGRIRARSQEKIILKHRNLDSTELLKSVQREVSSNESVALFLKQQGVSIVEIDASLSLNEIAIRAKDVLDGSVERQV